MIVRLPDNTETDAHFSTEPAASSHGIPVLVIDGEPHGPAEVVSRTAMLLLLAIPPSNSVIKAPSNLSSSREARPTRYNGA